jgi:hypothetical protein
MMTWLNCFISMLLLPICVNTGDPDLPLFQDGWQLRKDKEGIRVFSRPVEGNGVNELKVEMTLQARMSSLVALVMDVANYPSWAFNTEETRLLKAVSAAEIYYYTLIHTPWPVSNRDLPVHLTVRQDSVSAELAMRAECIPDLVPRRKDAVRVPSSLEQWRVSPRPGGKISIVYRIRLDPGSSLPCWMVNFFSTNGPYETFYHLREEIRKPGYRDAKISFIRD